MRPNDLAGHAPPDLLDQGHALARAHAAPVQAGRETLHPGDELRVGEALGRSVERAPDQERMIGSLPGLPA